MKTIIFVANPFGYGPAGKLDSIIKSLSGLVSKKRTKLIFIGNEFCREIVKANGVKWIKADERSPEALQKILAGFKQSYVFSSQNRIIIETARKLNIPCAFLDGLAWFWVKIPEAHLQADIIFWIKYPGLEAKIPADYNIYLVSGIVSRNKLRADLKKRENFVIVHIGGGLNPLVPGLPESWLQIFAEALTGVRKKILICGGKEMMDFMNQKNLPKNITCRNLSHDQLNKKMRSVKRFITTGGQTAVAEAMASGATIAFLPSYNLSQAALVELLRKEFAAPLRFDWQDLGFEIPTGVEKEAIRRYKHYARQTLITPWLKEEAIARIRDLILDDADFSGQGRFINKLGKDGAGQIAVILKKTWNLQ